MPKICHFHGKELNQQNAKDLAKFDMVLTTYTHVTKDFNSLETWMLDMKYHREFPYPYESSRIIKSSRTSFHCQELSFIRAKCPLFNVDWSQIILDEAQNIKNKKGKSFRACCALKEDYGNTNFERLHRHILVRLFSQS